MNKTSAFLTLCLWSGVVAACSGGGSKDSGGDTASGADSGTTSSTSGGVTNTSDTSSSTDTTDTSSSSSTGGSSSSSSTGGSGGTGGDSSTEDTSTTSASTTGGDDADCMTPPDPPPLIGWASEDGGTDGGGDAEPIVVNSASAFVSAVSGNQAAVIHVNGSIEGDFSVGSNKTIIGVCGGEIQGSINISNQQNVIMRNLTVVGHNCSDSPLECGAGTDAIGVHTSQHLWFDHMDISDGSDGNLDMTNNSDFITISWTKFWYSTMRSDPEQGESGHRFSNLIAASDSDAGEYRITFHHNWWGQNIDQRMPRSRFGDIHVFNNLFTAEGNSYCTNAGFDTHLLVENNLYRGVNNPLSPDGNGDMRAEGNEFDNVTGNTSDNGGVGFDPPYDYDLDPTEGLDDLIQAEAGPQD